MKEVASLRYGTIFKKAFSDPEIFTAFVEDVLGIKVEIETVETEKSFSPTIGHVSARFDLFAEDNKNRVIVDIQHARRSDHYAPRKRGDRFLHYHCIAILEQIPNSYDYKPPLLVYTVVVLTSGDKYQKDVLITDFRPRDLSGQPVGEIEHKIVYVNPNYVSQDTPAPLREWLLAIADSLDEKVDESLYERPEIRKVFDLIKKDTISPEERAQMIEEYHSEKAKHTAFSEGARQALIETAKRFLSQGLDVSMVSSGTGLTEAEVMALKNSPS
ncbi:MAG: PD-(D/E)XK nuclease family transposase [Ardenticatenaceae bacterium]